MDKNTYCLLEAQFRPKDTNRWKVKEWKKIFRASNNQMRAGVAILILDKVDFKFKKITIETKKDII